MTTEVSVVIPTLRERANLEKLLPRLFETLDRADIRTEIIIVDDDSRDGTDDLCEQLSARHPLRLITRRDVRGLASAVIRGLQESKGEIFVVMDADLSHPPEAVPDLVDSIRSPFCDIAIGSRYVNGGSVDPSWSWFRRLNSKVATLLAKGLTEAADPLAGFFAIRRDTFLRATELRPLGYKVLLELIVRCDCRDIFEVPIAFRDRKLGTSKLSAGQIWLYLRHLTRLYAAHFSARRMGTRHVSAAQSTATFSRRESA
jgi:dolichol-phosphate mannosyltransferase